MKIKKIIATLLVLCMVLGCMGMTAMAAEEAEAIVPGEPKSLTVSTGGSYVDEYVYYSFTPEVSGEYMFSVSYDESLDNGLAMYLQVDDGDEYVSYGEPLVFRSGQSGISDVICGVEACVQHHVEDEEEGILSGLAPGSGNRENREQADTTAQIGPQHPGPGFTHLRMGLIDEGAKDDVRDAVKDLSHCHQGTDNTGVQADGIGQVDHNEEGQERIDHVAGDIARAVTHLVVPFQISLFSHDVFSFSLIDN